MPAMRERAEFNLVLVGWWIFVFIRREKTVMMNV